MQSGKILKSGYISRGDCPISLETPEGVKVRRGKWKKEGRIIYYADPYTGFLIPFDSKLEMEFYTRTLIPWIEDRHAFDAELKPVFQWMAQLKRDGVNRTMPKRRYTPDFVFTAGHGLRIYLGDEVWWTIPNGERVVVEVKGYFYPRDRMRVQGWANAHPLHGLLIAHSKKQWEYFAPRERVKINYASSTN